MEIWKYIEGYEGYYQVSNFGNVKSLKYGREKILKPHLTIHGYKSVFLSNKGICKKFTIHKLVSMAFLNHIPDGTHKLVINHINLNKLDNRVENLEIISNRDNSNKKHLKSSSQYTGVCRQKGSSKWIASMHFNGKTKYLGSFESEIEASNCYESAIKKLNQNINQ